jgi:hypothetical protein
MCTPQGIVTRDSGVVGSPSSDDHMTRATSLSSTAPPSKEALQNHMSLTNGMINNEYFLYQTFTISVTCIRMTLVSHSGVACAQLCILYHFLISYFSDLYSNDTCAPLWGCVCPAFQMTSGGICPMGYYCPVGSSQPTACTPGMYCETPGLPLPTGQSEVIVSRNHCQQKSLF